MKTISRPVKKSKVKRFDFVKKPYYFSPMRHIAYLAAKFVLRGGDVRIRRVDMEGLKPPYFILANHASVYDMATSMLVNYPHRTYNVVALDGLYDFTEPLMRSIGTIAKRKFIKDFMLLKNMKYVVTRCKDAILMMYPEAKYSLQGATSYLPPTLGKLAKFLGVPVVSCHLSGCYVNAPQWHKIYNKRPKIEAVITQTCTAEDVKNLSEEELQKKIDEAVKLHNQAFRNNGMPDCVVDAEKLAKTLSKKYMPILSPYITNIEPIIDNSIDNSEKIVVEGAQAFRLDLDHGDYPMVTSSNPVSAGTLCGAGLPPQAVYQVIGITKAYSSRVGNGPFPTELPASIDEDGNVIKDAEPLPGDIIREFGHEYGTTTKRPRRCGWLDAVILHSAKYTCGIDCLCINHLDTLGKIGLALGYIKICTSYQYGEQIIDYVPDNTELTGEIPIPVYKTLKGGWTIYSSCKTYDELPELAKEFINIVEEVSGIPVKYVGVGPANDDLIEIF